MWFCLQQQKPMHVVIVQSSALLEFSATQDRRKKYDVTIEGIGALAQTRTNGSVELTLQATEDDFSLKINALVISSITSTTPTVHVDVKQWRHLTGLQLADPHFGTPGGIDMLIGSDVWGLIVQGDIVSGGPKDPHAQRIRLGWVVFGPACATKTAESPLIRTFSAQVCEEKPSLEDILQRFWKLEEVPDDCQEDEECSRIFASTRHTRSAEGRYIVHIPFQPQKKQLGLSYFNALRQFYSLERRLANNKELRDRYVTFMREYATLGHMQLIDQPGDHADCYYIPHHAVTEKFRVVFNASALTSNGVSLNDIQLAGPTIQDPLVHVIFRFRKFRTAVTADIEKMFRQVLVTPKHRNSQRILWRESISDSVKVYQLATVTYGMKGSTFNAVRSLHQCAYDNFKQVIDDNTTEKDAMTARDAILRSFYVDDFLASCDGEEKAIHLAANVDKILLAGQFKLRKWNSNSIQVLNCFSNNNCSPTELIIESPTATVLGLRWDCTSDELFFNVNLKKRCETPTKRLVLSEVAQLFDPTGLLAPIVIIGKIFIQTLWAAGVTWDDLLPSELCDKWISFRDGLAALNCVRVPRWLGMAEEEKTVLHGFCDASTKAYAAVIYVKTSRSRTGEPAQISLLTTRTKVAPLKGATIPRLELCAAHLLAVTLENVRMALGLMDTPYYLWSDSSIVLCWLKKHPDTLKPYVSNRVRQIQDLTSPEKWNYVRSAQNPADCASRGLEAAELLEHKLWWQGPGWLKESSVFIEEKLPFSEDELQTIRREEKLSTVVMVTSENNYLTTTQRDGKIIPLTERFSSFQKLLNTIVYMLRWLKKNRTLRKSAIIKPFETEDALNILLRMEQALLFAPEIHQLRSGSGVSSSSRLISLNPFLDDHGTMRVGGRISKATSVSQDRRFPIILPKRSALVSLIIKEAHIRTLHGGPQIMLQNLRERFWILNGRQAVRNNLCVICRRQRGATLTQQMASLSRQRVNVARPFIAAGVDYCGPFMLRVGTKRSRATTKTYLAIFVCMATKAVHIEVVDDLSAQAFLDAFTRFVSRRGICRDLYSDNGTAFVGANRLLKEDLAAWTNDNNKQSLSDRGTNWHFITPSGPHQGGLWEAAVKSAKYHLVRLIGSQVMWHNQLHTLAVRIEACLNSRPITPIHDDPDDKMALTPEDFLIGAPLIAVPELTYNEIPLNRLKHWQWLRQIHQSFWERWSEEYLSTLQTRSKWQRRMDDIKIGDIVLVRHENLPPTHWRLGRVTEVHPGSDGLIRNVTLKTQNGYCRRAVQKLCRLLEADPGDSIEPIGSTGQDV